MENAAKALIIAGGILLAIMTLTLLVYGITSTSRIEQAKAESEKIQEITNFNMEYEAYNKKRMYGIDVISVINKAINHNKAMNAANIGNPYYINIKLITKEEFKSELHIITYDKNTGDTTEKYDQPVSSIPSGSEWDTMRNLLNESTFMEKDTQYELLEIHGNNAKIQKDFRNKFEGSLNNITKTKEDTLTRKTYIVYSALTNFKKAIFECKGTHYNDKTGRIDEIIFEQYEM